MRRRVSLSQRLVGRLRFRGRARMPVRLTYVHQWYTSPTRRARTAAASATIGRAGRAPGRTS